MTYYTHIWNHAGKTFPIIGGLHTAYSLKELLIAIDQKKLKGYKAAPERWLHWPAFAYFFDGPLEDHYRELLLIGNLDNDVVQLPVSFIDRLEKLRELFKAEFKDLQDYRDAMAIVKCKDRPDRHRISIWVSNAKEALNLRTGQFGHMRQLVAVSENQPTGKRGKDSKKAIGSPADLFAFMGVPAEKLEDLLESILNGDMKLAEGLSMAKEFKTVSVLQRHFEKSINELFAQPWKQRAQLLREKLWITWEKVKERVPAVEPQSVIYRHYFTKKKLSALEARAWENWVKTVKDSYARNPFVSRLVRGAVKVPVLSVTFQALLNAEQRGRLGKEAVKFETVMSSDESHGVLLINDTTQNLANYLEIKSANFGKC